MGCMTPIFLLAIAGSPTGFPSAIYINQAKLGTKWTEANKKVKRERESAMPPKQTNFAKVPYEFVPAMTENSS